MHLFELRPNCSLTPRAAAVFFLTIGAVPLAMAASFTALGFWPILPFAGLELAGLGAALAVSLRRGQVRETVRVDGDLVVVQRGRAGDGPDAASGEALPRPWTRVELRPGAHAHWPSRLLLRSGHRAVEVGAFLTEDERCGLKDRLAAVIPGPAGRGAGPVDRQMDDADEWSPYGPHEDP